MLLRFCSIITFLMMHDVVTCNMAYECHKVSEKYGGISQSMERDMAWSQSNWSMMLVELPGKNVEGQIVPPLTGMRARVGGGEYRGWLCHYYMPETVTCYCSFHLRQADIKFEQVRHLLKTFSFRSYSALWLSVKFFFSSFRTCTALECTIYGADELCDVIRW